MTSTPGMHSVLVTGASSGIGRSIALYLADQGHSVWGTARDISRVPSHDRISPIALDLADLQSIERAVEQVTKETKSIDVLINNAGNGIYGPAILFSPEDLQKQFQILVAGPFRLTQLVVPLMEQNQKGLVINTTSIGAQFPIPFMGPYSACKAALSMLTDSLQVECKGKGVAFVDLRPGDIRTGFNSAAQHLQAVWPERWDTICKKTWDVLEKDMNEAPGAEVVAQKVGQIIQQSHSGRYVVGSFFQTRLAPIAERLMPRGWILKLLGIYYRLTGD